MSNKQLYMITGDWCPHCANAKKQLKDVIDKGIIRILELSMDPDKNDEKILELAEKLDVEMVPTLVVEEKTENGKSKFCVVDDKNLPSLTEEQLRKMDLKTLRCSIFDKLP